MASIDNDNAGATAIPTAVIYRPFGPAASQLKLAAQAAATREQASAFGRRLEKLFESPEGTINPNLVFQRTNDDPQPGDLIIKGEGSARVATANGNLDLATRPPRRLIASPGLAIAKRIKGLTDDEMLLLDQAYRETHPVSWVHRDSDIAGLMTRTRNRHWNNALGETVHFEGLVRGQLMRLEVHRDITMYNPYDDEAQPKTDQPDWYNKQATTDAIRRVAKTRSQHQSPITGDLAPYAKSPKSPRRRLKKKALPIGPRTASFISQARDILTKKDLEEQNIDQLLNPAIHIASAIEAKNIHRDAIRHKQRVRSLLDPDVLKACDRLQLWEYKVYNIISDPDPQRRRNLLDAAQSHPVLLREAITKQIKQASNRLDFSLDGMQSKNYKTGSTGLEEIASGKNPADVFAAAHGTNSATIKRLQGLTPAMLAGHDVLREARHDTRQLIRSASQVPAPMMPKKRKEWIGMLEAYRNHTDSGIAWDQSNATKSAKDWEVAARRVPPYSELNDTLNDLGRRLSGLVRVAKAQAGLPWGDEFPKTQTTAKQISQWLVGQGDVSRLSEVNDRWHRAQPKLLDALPGANSKWAPLAPPGTTPNGVQYEFLTSEADLKMVGTKQNHCVGGYADACLRDSHIVVLKDKNGEILSTMQLMETTNKEGKRVVQNIQNQGVGNSVPAKAAIEAGNWLETSISKGKLEAHWEKVDEARRLPRVTNSARHTVLGFDPYHQPEVAEKLWKIYQDIVPSLKKHASLSAFAASPASDLLVQNRDPTREDEPTYWNYHNGRQYPSEVERATQRAVATLQKAGLDSSVDAHDLRRAVQIIEDHQRQFPVDRKSIFEQIGQSADAKTLVDLYEVTRYEERQSLIRGRWSISSGAEMANLIREIGREHMIDLGVGVDIFHLAPPEKTRELVETISETSPSIDTLRMAQNGLSPENPSAGVLKEVVTMKTKALEDLAARAAEADGKPFQITPDQASKTLNESAWTGLNHRVPDILNDLGKHVDAAWIQSFTLVSSGYPKECTTCLIEGFVEKNGDRSLVELAAAGLLADPNMAKYAIQHLKTDPKRQAAVVALVAHDNQTDVSTVSRGMRQEALRNLIDASYFAERPEMILAPAAIALQTTEDLDGKLVAKLASLSFDRENPSQALINTIKHIGRVAPGILEEALAIAISSSADQLGNRATAATRALAASGADPLKPIQLPGETKATDALERAAIASAEGKWARLEAVLTHSPSSVPAAAARKGSLEQIMETSYAGLEVLNNAIKKHQQATNMAQAQNSSRPAIRQFIPA